MVNIAIINGDTSVCHGLEKCLSTETVKLTVEEGVRAITDIPKETYEADFILLDSQLLKDIPLSKWQEKTKRSKVILLTTFAQEAYALEQIGKKVQGVFTKTMDRKKWQAAIYHAKKEQTPAEHYFITQLIPRILQWEEQESFLEKGTTVLEAEVIRLLDDGYTGVEIAYQLQVDREQIEEFIAMIGKVRSAS